MFHRLTPLVLVCVLAAPAQKAYNGPRPPKPDVPFLLHASNLVPTEVTEAKEETRKDDTILTIAGANSSARTPLAEPVFLFESKAIAPEKLQLYRLDVKSGRREIVLRRRKAPQPVPLSITRLAPGLFRIEANQYLENGEYSLSPDGSNQAFCFQVY